MFILIIKWSLLKEEAQGLLDYAKQEESKQIQI